MDILSHLKGPRISKIGGYSQLGTVPGEEEPGLPWQVERAN